MGVRCRITLYAPDGERGHEAAAAAFARIAELDALLSDWRLDSELNRLSDGAGGPPVRTSDDLYRVLELSRDYSEATAGAFDATVGPVVRLWREARRQGSLPDADALRAAATLVGWKGVELDTERRTVRLVRPGMRLDLGGIGKGYIADRAAEVLRERGIDRYLIDLGGDLVAGGPPPGREGWEIRISHGTGLDRTLLLADAAAATSGDTEQFIEIEGVRYSHIVDPRTGLGLTDRLAVTVIASDGATADALASAISVLGEDRWWTIAPRFEGVRVLIDRAEESSDHPR